MVKFKDRDCPKCKVVMRYCGSRVWECQKCGFRYFIQKNAIVEEDKLLKIRRFIGYKYIVKKWKVKGL